MTGKIHKRFVVPEGYEIVDPLAHFGNKRIPYEEKQRLLEEDFAKHRAQYIQLEKYGLMIWVKVRPVDAAAQK